MNIIKIMSCENMTFKEWKRILKRFDIGDNIILSYIQRKKGEVKIKCGIARLSYTGISIFEYLGFPKTKFVSYQRVRDIKRCW